MTTFDIAALPGNAYKMDAGLMFGTVERSKWEQWVHHDADNRIEVTSHILFIRTANFKILFDPGPGICVPPGSISKENGFQTEHRLLHSLRNMDVDPASITHVILSHLHTHCAGGMLHRQKGQKSASKLAFNNARCLVSRENWDRARSPHLLDEHLFMTELICLLKGSEQLEFVSDKDKLFFDDIEISFIQSQGHTPGMLMPLVSFDDKKIQLCSDMIPGVIWNDQLINTGYDRYPELLATEKKQMQQVVFQDRVWIFYPNDVDYVLSGLEFDDIGNTFLPLNPLKSLSL